jgi:hypothetical protein
LKISYYKLWKLMIDKEISGVQRRYDAKTKAQKKAEMDAKKCPVRRGHGKGRVHSCKQVTEARAKSSQAERYRLANCGKPIAGSETDTSHWRGVRFVLLWGRK